MPPLAFLHILKFYLTIIGANAERVELAGSHLGSVQDLGVEGGGQAGHDQQPPGGHRPGHCRHPWWTHLRCWQPQCSRLDPWSFDIWRSKTNTGSKCFFLLFNIRHAIKVTLWKYITVIMFLTSLNFCSRSLILLQISCWTIGLIVALLTIDCVLGSRFAIIDCFTNIAF